MSPFQDFNNSIKQNEKLKPSRRAKFRPSSKTNSSKTHSNGTQLRFKVVSEFELKKIKKHIKTVFQQKRKQELILLASLLLVILFLITMSLVWIFSHEI